jgi:hypothetical protein
MEEVTNKYVIIPSNVLCTLSLSLFFSYYNLSSEILSSVRKMEDSIRRLRHVRESSKTLSTMSTSMSTSTTAALTDDNKIRMQIQNDVNAFTSEVSLSSLLSSHRQDILLLVGQTRHSNRSVEQTDHS